LIRVGDVSLRLAGVIAAIAVLLAGCGGPPLGLENRWQSMMAARQQYEMCTAWRYRDIAACDAVLAVYRTEQARYNADLEAKGTTIAR
jgi:hypothetical protein